ncbi:MAG: HPr family phosphocarrier protein [Proteobacteria bacterium]|nr:HPr family phosphocarrier protein [Pseudomonadota bacterium]
MAEFITKTFQIQNKLGLHARAASLFVQLAGKFDAEITVSKGDQEVNGKSIMGILILAAPTGSEVIVKASGPQADEAVAALGALIDDKFEEGE